MWTSTPKHSWAGFATRRWSKIHIFGWRVLTLWWIIVWVYTPIPRKIVGDHGILTSPWKTTQMLSEIRPWMGTHMAQKVTNHSWKWRSNKKSIEQNERQRNSLFSSFPCFEFWNTTLQSFYRVTSLPPPGRFLGCFMVVLDTASLHFYAKTLRVWVDVTCSAWRWTPLVPKVYQPLRSKPLIVVISNSYQRSLH